MTLIRKESKDFVMKFNNCITYFATFILSSSIIITMSICNFSLVLIPQLFIYLLLFLFIVIQISIERSRFVSKEETPGYKEICKKYFITGNTNLIKVSFSFNLLQVKMICLPVLQILRTLIYIHQTWAVILYPRNHAKSKLFYISY